MASIGVDLKGFKKDLRSAEKLAKGFKNDSEVSDIDINVDVNTDGVQAGIDEIASLASAADQDLSVDADADINTDSFMSGVEGIEERASSAEADVDGEAKLGANQFYGALESAERSANNADTDVEGDATLDSSDFDSKLETIVSSAGSADADVNGEAKLGAGQFYGALASTERAANNADADVEGDATLDPSDFDKALETIVADAGSANADVEGEATLDPGLFHDALNDVTSSADNADADVDGEATLDPSDFDSTLEAIVSDAGSADANVDGEATLESEQFYGTLSGVERAAKSADADVDGEATLDPSGFDAALEAIVSDAGSADADVDGKATLDPSDFNGTLEVIVSDAGSADADVEGDATLDPSQFDATLDEAEQRAENADINIEGTIHITGDDIEDAIEDAETLRDTVSDVNKEIGNADTGLNNLGKQMGVQNVIDALGGIESKLRGIISMAGQAAKALVDMSADASSWADDLITESQQYGIGQEQIQRMRYASKFIDTEVSTIEQATQRLTKAITSDSESAKNAFEELGVSVKDETTGNLRDSLDVFWDIIDVAKNMRQAGLETEMEGLLMDTLGRNVAELGPLINAGSEAYRQMMDEAPVVTEQAVAALGEYNDSIQELTSNVETTKLELMGALAPAFTEAANALSEFVKQFNEFLNTEEGKKAIENLKGAIESLVTSLTSEDSISSLFETATGAIETFNGALEWISNNSDGIVKTFEGIAFAIAGIEISKDVLTFIQLITGMKSLLGGAAGSGGAANAAGAGGGGVLSKLGNGALAIVDKAPFLAPLAAIGIAGKLYNKQEQQYINDMYGDYIEKAKDIDELDDDLTRRTKEYGNALDDVTQKLERASETQHEYGETSEDIRALQQELLDEGYNLGETGVDSIYGPRTEAAVEQRKADLANEQAELEAQLASTERVREMLSEANRISKEAFDDDTEWSDYVQHTKEFLENYASEFSNMFPEMNIWDILKSNGFDPENLDTEALFGTHLLAGGELETFATDIAVALTDAIKNSDSEGIDLSELFSDDTTDLEEHIRQIADSSEEDLRTGTESGISKGSDAGAAEMGESIATSGEEAAAAVEKALDEAIGKPRDLDISGPVWAGKGVGHATGMYGGDIVRGLTPIGFGAGGTLHYAGESGAEAVVGVNSLDRMIQSSVEDAMVGVLARMDALISGQGRQGDLKVVLDTGATVGGLVREMDKQLGSRGSWRGGGRT